MRLLSIICLLSTIAYATTLRRVSPITDELPLREIGLPDVQSVRAWPASGIEPISRIEPRRLDEVYCAYDFAPIVPPAVPSLTQLDSGAVLALWVQSGLCPQCGASEAIRVQSIIPLLFRPDGSPADTLDLEIAAYCPADGDSACSGLGVLRGRRITSLVFGIDLQDGQAEITANTIEFSGILVDSIGGFITIRSLGTRQGTTVSLMSEANSPLPIQDCHAWFGSDSLSYWNSNWEPGHSGPAVSVGWTCDLADTVFVPSCPESCTFVRFNGPQAYFDPFTSVVYQWIEPAAGSYPIAPQSLDIKLYFENVGSETDRAFFQVIFACPGFGSQCCPPAEQICNVPASVVRGTGFQTVLDVHLDFGDLACCLNAPFWLGVVIDSVTGGAALPSFLYSAQNADPTPPQPCEQWSGTPGSLVSLRNDGVAWADMRLNTFCKSCLEESIQICSPSPQVLNCATATNVACSELGVFLPNVVVVPGTGTASRYCCSDLTYPGREAVFRMQVPNQGNLRIQATPDTLEHVTIFLLEDCNTQNCVAIGVDSLFASGLTNGQYYVICEGRDVEGMQFDLQFNCIADCNHEICVADLRGGPAVGNRYLDGEGDGTGNVFFQSYYAGSGNTQTILRFDGSSCDSLTPVTWHSLENSPSRMLAFDPRNGGEFWCGTSIDFFTGTGRMYRLTNGGGVVQSWTSLAGLPIMRWSGAAFDPTHNHMWVFVRDSSNTGNSRAYEIDVTNSQQPVVIQGPHPLPQQSPNQSLSCAGADYAHLSNHLLVVHQGSPEDFVQCYIDLEPGYNGPRPGPGFAPVSWCTPDSNGNQGYGIAAIEDSTGGMIALTNFTDSDWTHPVARYVPPCRLTPPRCVAPNDLVVFSDGTGTILTWTSTYPGTYDIYSSVDPSNDGNPDGGADSTFHLEASLSLPAGSAQWSDPDQVSTYKYYTIVLTCAARIE